MYRILFSVWLAVKTDEKLTNRYIYSNRELFLLVGSGKKYVPNNRNAFIDTLYTYCSAVMKVKMFLQSDDDYRIEYIENCIN